MLRTNLASRPFYNQRLVSSVLVALALMLAGLTLYSLTRLAMLGAADRRLTNQVEQAEQQTRKLRSDAQAIRKGLDAAAVSAVESQAAQANALIDRRAFSWTALFNRFEATLPADVRIVAVQPQVSSDQRLVIAITTVSRDIADLDSFIERLEATGAFQSTLSRQEELQEDGTLRSVVQGYYTEPAAGNAPAASEQPERGAPRVAAQSLP